MRLWIEERGRTREALVLVVLVLDTEEWRWCRWGRGRDTDENVTVNESSGTDCVQYEVWRAVSDGRRLLRNGRSMTWSMGGLLIVSRPSMAS